MRGIRRIGGGRIGVVGFALYDDRMRITVNGEPREMGDGLTVETLLDALDLQGKPCAVEVNRRVVPRRDHPEQHLADGDSIEIVTLVGGG
jgi:thiamine biosynthesis protein ThiS